MAKILSPCIDICKFKREGHCIGCSMTKAQKSTFKAVSYTHLTLPTKA